MVQKTTDIERAADQLREAAARFEREADLLDTLGERLALTSAPRNMQTRRLIEQAEQLDALTMLVEGGDPLADAIAEVMVRGWRPEPLGPEWGLATVAA
jgi:hypothetical protein